MFTSDLFYAIFADFVYSLWRALKFQVLHS